MHRNPPIKYTGKSEGEFMLFYVQSLQRIYVQFEVSAFEGYYQIEIQGNILILNYVNNRVWGQSQERRWWSSNSKKWTWVYFVVLILFNSYKIPFIEVLPPIGYQSAVRHILQKKIISGLNKTEVITLLYKAQADVMAMLWQVVRGPDFSSCCSVVPRVLFSSTGTKLAHPASEFQPLGRRKGRSHLLTAHWPEFKHRPHQAPRKTEKRSVSWVPMCPVKDSITIKRRRGQISRNS